MQYSNENFTRRFFIQKIYHDGHVTDSKYGTDKTHKMKANRQKLNNMPEQKKIGANPT